MSDTPRTDELLIEINEGRVYETVGPITELSRTLERELAAVQKEIEELKGIIAGVSSYLEGDPTFTKADEVLDKVEKIAEEYYK